jgi:hypothetical protein
VVVETPHFGPRRVQDMDLNPTFVLLRAAHDHTARVTGRAPG